MLLEIAIGDAYGAGFEYADRDMVRNSNNLEGYIKHPRHKLIPGSYTDDTQMSLAVAEALLSGEDWTPLLLANKFVEAFKRDKRQGYAGRFYEFLLKVQDGKQFLAEIRPESEKSGAAMRAAPIGVVSSLKEVIQMTTLQAKLTHNTPLGIAAAIASALMSHYFIYNLGPKAELGKFLDQHVPDYKGWAQPYQGKVGSLGVKSAHAAATAVIQNDALSEVLRACINFTGDVDTVAAIAMGAASCSTEISKDLPEHLVYALENGKYGKDYILSLDEKLMGLVAK